MIIDRRYLETRWWGPPPEAAPTLVLLHEGLGCVALWRDFPEALAAATGCGVFAYSRFGYGGSDPVTLPRPMRYMHDEALEVLPRVLDAADVRRAVLVGHSDGGSIAAIHAGTVHDPRVLGRGDDRRALLRRGHQHRQHPRHQGRPTRHGDLRARLARYHRDVDVAFRGWNDAWLDPRFRAFDITEQVARIQVPVLALQGTDDPYGTEEQLRVLERARNVSGRDAADRRRPSCAAPGGEAARRWTPIVPFVRQRV